MASYRLIGAMLVKLHQTSSRRKHIQLSQRDYWTFLLGRSGTKYWGASVKLIASFPLIG
jgi:hypothetical protein